MPSPISMLGLLLVVLVLLWIAVNAEKTPADFFHVFLIGITNGSVYGLVALGYTLVYGILELINFAHGDVFMLGGMISRSPSRISSRSPPTPGSCSGCSCSRSCSSGWPAAA